MTKSTAQTDYMATEEEQEAKKNLCQTEESRREMTEWWGEEVDGCSLDNDHTHTSWWRQITSAEVNIWKRKKKKFRSAHHLIFDEWDSRETCRFSNKQARGSQWRLMWLEPSQMLGRSKRLFDTENMGLLWCTVDCPKSVKMPPPLKKKN